MLSWCYSAMFPLSFSPSDSLQIGDPVHRNIFPAMCMVTYCDNSQSICCSFAFRHPPWLTWVLSGQIGRIIPQRKYNEITKLRQWWQRKLKKSKRLNKQNNNSACASRFSVHLLAVPSNYDVKWPNFKLPSLYNYDVKRPIFKFTWERERQDDKFYWYWISVWTRTRSPLFSSNLISLLLSNRATWNNYENVWKVVFGHFSSQKGTGTEMRPAIVSGIVIGFVPVSYWPMFSPVLCIRPRSLCES